MGVGKGKRGEIIRERGEGVQESGVELKLHEAFDCITSSVLIGRP